jgi:Tfp pilus assembly protein PilO
MDDFVAGLIKALAPTVADRILGVLGERKMKRDELNLVVLSLLAEQNQSLARSLNEMGKQLCSLNEGMSAVLKELKNTGEGIAVLLKRTEG